MGGSYSHITSAAFGRCLDVTVSPCLMHIPAGRMEKSRDGDMEVVEGKEEGKGWRGRARWGVPSREGEMEEQGRTWCSPAPRPRWVISTLVLVPPRAQGAQEGSGSRCWDAELPPSPLPYPMCGAAAPRARYLCV